MDELADAVAGDVPRALAVDASRHALAEARTVILAGGAVERRALVDDARQRAAAAWRLTLRPVINGTGVVLHTNLGRAPWAAAAIEAAAAVARGWCNLELRLDDGARGGRGDGVEALLASLTGAEAAAVVNNGAAAVLLAVTALAGGGEVVVSRGELVEIGGSFRVPDIVALSGARLVEVGTTNRTRASDYAAALGPATRALLVVHPSNYRMSGFVGQPDLEELATLAAGHGVPLVHDVGSGALRPLAGEPSVAASLAAGVGLVTCSGDKLLGGPQAGLVIGRADLVARVRRHPLYRAMRVDKVTLAALEATLRAWRWGGPVPARDLREAPSAALRARAERLALALERFGVRAAVVEVAGTTGGGSLPGDALPGWGVDVRVRDPDHAAAELRRGEPAILVLRAGAAVRVDVRTVLPEDEEALARRLADVAVAR